MGANVRRLSLEGRIALCLVITITGVAVLAPVISPYAYHYQHRSTVLAPPDLVHLLGTDHLGRDLMSRLFWGARVSLSVGLTVAIASSIVGAAVGMPSGYYGGLLDAFAMRAVEVFSAFPSILLAITLMSVFGAGFLNIVVALTLAGFSGAARLTRSETRRLCSEEFIMAARALGLTNASIMLKHILPNVMAPLLVYATSSVCWWVAAEAGLSFLGLGSAPTLPSWGSMIAEAVPFMKTRPLLLIAPCLMVSILALSLNLLGDSLEKAMSPWGTGTETHSRQYRDE